jgi:hypothetical protein
MNFDGFVKSSTVVRQIHGPEQSGWAALRFIPALLNSRKREGKDDLTG